MRRPGPERAGDGGAAEGRRVRRILAKLAALYPEARTALRWSTPFELLVATMLSAQSTDAGVNRVTERLFARPHEPEDLCRMGAEALAEEIRQLGLYRSKARHVVETACILAERYGGRVPRTLEELTSLPGVGRKTANVVLANAFGLPAIAVDTHVFRVSHRLGLADGRTPEATERQLQERIPRRLWSAAHHWLILHGRRVCTARRPRCEACALLEECPAGRAMREASGPLQAEGTAGGA
ncbi:MAG: endonuclease III, partial [Clostridia bacterium]|nr:endonuclease III [Clostridia bacterium]